MTDTLRAHAVFVALKTPFRGDGLAITGWASGSGGMLLKGRTPSYGVV